MAKKDNASKSAVKRNVEDTLSFYNEEMTRKVVGRLFEDYVDENEKNYFVGNNIDPDEVLYKDESLNRYNSEDEEELDYDEDYDEDYEDTEDDDDFDSVLRERFDEDDDDEDDEIVAPRRRRKPPVKSGKKKKKGFSLFGNKQSKEQKARQERINQARNANSVMDVFLNSAVAEEAEEERPIRKPVKREAPKPQPAPKKKRRPVEEEIKNPLSVLDDDFNDFDDDDDYEDDTRKIVAGIAITVATILFIVVLCMLFSYKGKLEEASIQIKELEKQAVSSTYETENAQLKATVDELNKQIEELKAANPEEITPGEQAINDALNEIEKEKEAEANAEEENSANAAYTEYTVKSGDNFWKISQSVYGNGAYANEIMEANGMNENSTLGIGDVLKIPNR